MSTADPFASGDSAAADRPPTKASWWYRLSHPLRWLGRQRFQITLSLLIAAFVMTALWREVVVSNHSGEQSVYWSRFLGGTSDRLLGEGAHLKFPWDDIVVYNTRVTETNGKTNMLTRDGLEIVVDWSARYRVVPEQLPLLHRTLGPTYAQKVIIPEVISSLRKVLGNYTAEEIYSLDEAKLVDEIDKTVKMQVKRFHPLVLESVLLLRVDLPPTMAKGIVDKLLFEQSLLAYRFRLQAEEQEGKRKLIEAAGIKEFERVTGISMLRWRAIDATQELAKSPNAKIIIMGTAQSSLPVLLNADQTVPSMPSSATSSLPTRQSTALPNGSSGVR